MSLEEAFKLLIAVLLSVLGYVGSRVFAATMQNTIAINKLIIEMEHVGKLTNLLNLRFSKMEDELVALTATKRNSHFKGNGK